MASFSSTMNGSLDATMNLDESLAAAQAKLSMAQSRVQALEQEETTRREEAVRATQELQHLEQLKDYASAEKSLQDARSRILELEASRDQAVQQMSHASRDAQMLRGGLYEMPMAATQTYGGTPQNPKLNKLQAQAYIERHDLELLMEDLLANLIEYMPTFPLPFLVKLMKQKMGITSDEAEVAKRRAVELAAANDKLASTCKQYEAQVQEVTAHLKEHRDLLDTAQRELKHTTEDLSLTAKRERSTAELLERQIKSLQDDVDKEKLHVVNLEASLRASQDQCQAAQEQLAGRDTQVAGLETERDSMRASFLELMQESKQGHDETKAELEAAKKEAADLAQQASAASLDSEEAERLKRKIRDLESEVDGFRSAERDLKAQAEAAKAQHAEEQRAAVDAAKAAAAAQEQQKLQELQATLAQVKQTQAAAAAAVPAKQEYAEETDVAETFTAANINYRIRVTTGQVKYAGTDAKVHIKLFGEKGQTDKIKLDKGERKRDLFEKGRTDIFVVENRNIGRIQKIQIGHNGGGLGAGWYLDTVQVDVPSLGKQYMFTADRWLDKSTGDGKREIELNASEETLQQYVPKDAYVLRTLTSDKKDATLDGSTVYVTVYGANGKKSEEVELKGDEVNFDKRGKVDEFNIDLEELGPVDKIQIRHNNKGLLFGGTWHLGYVELHDLKDDIVYKCHADRWLSKKHGIQADLPVTSITKEGVETATGASNSIYEVTVQTGDVSGAGTDANIFIMITGDKSDTGERKLTKSKTHSLDKFERGNKDVFDIEASDLGALTAIKVWRDTSDLMGGDWYLESITVKSCDTDGEVVFPCQAWLSKSRGDKQLMRWLKPRGDGPAELDVVKAVGMEYHLTVYTSDIKEASTDAKVWVDMVGESASSDRIPLLKSLTHRDKFQRGAVDKFVVTAVNVGEVKQLRIGHNNARAGILTNPSWHLDKVVIDIPQLGKTICFPAERWLAKDQGDGMLECTLLPGDGGSDQAVAEYKPKQAWEVIVYTSDVKYAGTDAQVKMVIHGLDADRAEHTADLDFKGKQTKSSFEKGKEDRFSFEIEEIGEPFKLLVSQDNKGFGADWHLAKVVLINPATKSRYEFPCNDWLKSGGDNLQKELLLDSKVGASADGTTAEAKEKAVDVEYVVYTVHIITGQDKKAGTDANVTVQMFGDLGSSPVKKLKKSLVKGDKFESGRTDTFELKDMVDLGALKSINVVTDDHKGFKLMYPQWLLKAVKVECSNGTSAEFSCNQWFGKTTGREHAFEVKGAKAPRQSLMERTAAAGDLKKTKRMSQTAKVAAGPKAAGNVSLSATAPVKKKAAARSNLTYTISVATADVAKAGTDSRISIDVTGSLGSTLSPLRLDKSSTNKDKFERGKTDKFEFPDIKDLGSLKKIKVTSDSHRGKHLMNPQWNVESITITTSNGGSWFFKCQAWLSKKAGLVQTFVPSAAASNGNESDDNVQSFANKDVYNGDSSDGDA